MRVLSAHQPFAQLIVRGVMPFVPRPGATPRRERIAIHAAGKAPSHEILRLAVEHARLARTFANQGWTSREDLLALPRGAIVGTVELRAVRSVRDVLLDPRRADRSPDDQIDITAAGGDGRHDPDAFVMPVWPDDYLWMLANAIEIAPITGVTGRQNVWDLADDIARLVAGAERGAREAALTGAATRGSYAIRQPTKRRVRESLEALEARWRAQEAQRIELAARESREAERDLQWFAEEWLERRFARAMAHYLARYPLRAAGGAEEVRIVGPFLQSLFPGAEWVARLPFERRVRVHYREVLGAKTRPRTKRDRYWDLPWHIPRLARVVEIGEAAGVYVVRKRGRGADAARKARLAKLVKLDGEPEVHRQREDPNDPPDPRDFRGTS